MPKGLRIHCVYIVREEEKMEVEDCDGILGNEKEKRGKGLKTRRAFNMQGLMWPRDQPNSATTSFSTLSILPTTQQPRYIL